MPTKSELQLRLARLEAELARTRAEDSDSIRDPWGAVEEIRRVCAEYPEQESFVVLMLNARQRVLAVHRIALGSLAQVDVHPREVFRAAVRMCAHSIVMGHNHPSGDSSPSSGDRVLTRRMKKAGKILGIPVLDHIIVATDGHASFAALGLL